MSILLNEMVHRDSDDDLILPESVIARHIKERKENTWHKAVPGVGTCNVCEGANQDAGNPGVRLDPDDHNWKCKGCF